MKQKEILLVHGSVDAITLTTMDKASWKKYTHCRLASEWEWHEQYCFFPFEHCFPCPSPGNPIPHNVKRGGEQSGSVSVPRGRETIKTQLDDIAYCQTGQRADLAYGCAHWGGGGWMLEDVCMYLDTMFHFGVPGQRVFFGPLYLFSVPDGRLT